MSDTFAKLLEESMQDLNLSKGSLIQATVVDVAGDRVIVNAGLKSDAVIPSQ